MTDDAVIHLVAGDTEGAVVCLDQGRHKLLGRVTWRGVHLWCKICHEEHTMSWEQIRWLYARLKPAVATALEESSGHSLAPRENLR